jgi:hypothetical protein
MYRFLHHKTYTIMFVHFHNTKTFDEHFLQTHNFLLRTTFLASFIILHEQIQSNSVWNFHRFVIVVALGGISLFSIFLFTLSQRAFVIYCYFFIRNICQHLCIFLNTTLGSVQYSDNSC